MIGHRSDAFEDLNERVTTRSRDPFGTEGTVLVGTCSSTGWMEAVRNLIRRGALFMVNGAFAARWYEIARENGKNAVRCNVPWGWPVRAEAVETALDREACDAVALVHTETSTGVLSPLAEIAAALRGQPDVLLLVDAVSSLGAAPIEMDALGIDLCLAGSQKALGLPPGLALCAVSERAFARAADVPHRGHYFGCPARPDRLLRRFLEDRESWPYAYQEYSRRRVAVRVTRKGQVTIPLAIRERVGMLPDTEVELSVRGDTVILRKASRGGRRGRRLVQAMRGRVTAGLTTDEIMALTRRR
jgi:AbrB family looped-hinge helix DNA binding protein